MKKLIFSSSILMVCALLLSGCGNEIPEMDEEERSMVVNYAADIVQRYDSNHPVKLQTLISASENELHEDEPEQNNSEEKVQEALVDENKQNDEVRQEITQEAEVIDNTILNSDATLDSVLQLAPFSFTYIGYEVEDSYPVSGTESYFAMSATEGNELLILKFLASNQSAAEETLNVLEAGVRFKIRVNEESKNALTTMLLNDFANYQGTVEPGENVELVIICEILAQQTENIETLELVVKNAGETHTISLR